MQNEVKDFRRYKPFEYWYFFLMMIELGYLTPETRVMNGGLSHLVGFTIPFVFTMIVAIRNKVSFLDRRFQIVVVPVAIWCLCQVLFNKHYEPMYIGAYFVRIYFIFTAFVHVKVFGKKLFSLYEHFMVVFCKIALPIWVLSIIFPVAVGGVFRLLPRTGLGNHLLYLYNWIDMSRINASYYGIVRNSGFCWEPGFFSVLICLAMLFNMFRNQGLVLRGNSNFIWLAVALFSTMSTSGYIIAFVLVVLMAGKQLSVKYIIVLLFFLIPLGYFASKLVFISNKIEKRLDLTTQVDNYEMSVQFYEENPNEGFAMERLPSLYYQSINFIHAPVIGYGVYSYDSYFYKTNPVVIGFTGGLMQIFASYGIFLALFFFAFLFRSSCYIAQCFNSNKKWVYLIYCFLEMFSYPMFGFSILTALWFIADFSPKIVYEPLQIKENTNS